MQTQALPGLSSAPIDVFAPKASGRHPIICALHGSGGLPSSGASEFAQLLADRGFLVCVPHYFAPTRTMWADRSTIFREFPNWMRVISSALDVVSQHPQADASRIGLVGFSLGAYLSLSLGVEQPRVKAIVDFFGGMPDHFAEKLHRIAPVLVLHGEADQVVPVSEARKLANMFDERNLSYEMKLYKNAGHGFRGLDMLDAAQRTYFFLKKHLG